MSVGMMTPGEIREYNGKPARVLANGAILDRETGKIVGNTPQHAASTTIQSSERAKELAYTRWHGAAQDAYRRKVVDALAGRGESTVVETIEQARGEMIGVLVEEVVLNPDVRGIDRIKAHEHVLEQAGMDARPPKASHDQPGGGIQINIGAEVAAQMMSALMEQAQKRQILDAE